MNWIFANKAMAIPKGSAVMLYSEPKAGKSLIINSIIGETQRKNPKKDSVSLYFNSELRGMFDQGDLMGLDKNRTLVFDTNRPEEIFDFLDKEILPMLESGEMSVDVLALDSLNAIAGVKELNADSVTDHLMGDRALTLQRGLTRIMPIIRQHKITAFMVAQMRDNMDLASSGGKGPKKKAAAPNIAKYSCEYFIKLRKLTAAENKVDLDGNPYIDKDHKDLQGNPEITGHQIEIKMEESSLGIAGRAAIITLDLNKGIINTHEEVFHLAKNLGIIKSLGGAGYYELLGEKIHGKGAVAKKIKESTEIQNELLKQIGESEIKREG
jgi:RecA/RadA recombinase